MTTDLPVPDEAVSAVTLVAGAASFYESRDEAAMDVRAIARPVVVAELLALAGKVAALRDHGSERYVDGFDAAIGAVRELIADRCDELGTRVEDL